MCYNYKRMFIKKTNNVSTMKNGGISAHFSKTLNQIIKSDISTLLVYLRKRFVFPVKCNLYLCNKEFFISQKDGKRTYCVFYDNANENRKSYPQIFIPSRQSKNNTLREILFNLLSGLSMYFQWINKDQGTEKSLDEAVSEEASQILEEYECYLIARQFKNLRINDVKQSLLKGQGRALAIIKNNPKKYYKLVLYAATHDIAWDKYSGTHADYVYEMISAYQNKELFLNAIIGRMSTNTKPFLFGHLTWLLRCFSFDGSSVAKQALNNTYHQLIEEISHDKESKDRIIDNFVSICFAITESFVDFNNVAKDIIHLSKTTSFDVSKIQWFVDSNFDEYKKDILNDKSSFAYMLFKMAHVSHKRFAKDFSFKVNSNEQTVENLLQEINTTDKRRKRIIMESLMDIKNEKIREYALKHISNNNLYDLLPLLINNATKEDYELIMEYCQKVEFSFQSKRWHNVVSAIAMMKDAPVSLFKYVYENSYCSFCRDDVFQKMASRNMLTKEQVLESHYDCEETIREISSSL